MLRKLRGERRDFLSGEIRPEYSSTHRKEERGALARLGRGGDIQDLPVASVSESVSQR